MIQMEYQKIQNLENFLKNRPTKQFLKYKQILIDVSDNISPSLISIVKELEWRKKTKTIGKLILNRPNLRELELKGIIVNKEEKKQIFDTISKKIEKKIEVRPKVSTLIQKNILKLEDVPF
eukprot:EC826210.1.p1 GENE.EC826210.1~~EC826210.1.p1  ORF type:complete len:121 (+),score=44.63 EC826210.1:74-436(+)